jgi:hypothetical protein
MVSRKFVTDLLRSLCDRLRQSNLVHKNICKYQGVYKHQYL